MSGSVSDPVGVSAGFGVELRGVTARYGFRGATALRGVALQLRAGAVHGLLGRNGSGKSTLLALLAAYRRPSAGAVLVDGEDPFENARVMAGTCLVREGGDVVPTDRVVEVLAHTASMRERWDADLAGRLLERFEVRRLAKVGQLSRGKRSALGVVIGLASRAPLTLFDETTLGLDAPSRQAFTEELLADYVAHPRTLVLASHLVDELERVVEHVTVLDAGRVALHADVDEARASVVTVTADASRAAAFARGRRVLGTRSLGPTTEVTVVDPDGTAREHARLDGLDVGTSSLQDVLVHLTARQPRPAEVLR